MSTKEIDTLMALYDDIRNELLEEEAIWAFQDEDIVEEIEINIGELLQKRNHIQRNQRYFSRDFTKYTKIIRDLFFVWFLFSVLYGSQNIWDKFCKCQNTIVL